MTHDHEQHLWSNESITTVEFGNRVYQLYFCRVVTSNGVGVYGFINDTSYTLNIPLLETRQPDPIDSSSQCLELELRRKLSQYNTNQFGGEGDAVKIYERLGITFRPQARHGVITSTSGGYSPKGSSSELTVYMADYKSRTPQELAVEFANRLRLKIIPVSVDTVRSL